jgi:hypothetical protein
LKRGVILECENENRRKMERVFVVVVVVVVAERVQFDGLLLVWY